MLVFKLVYWVGDESKPRKPIIWQQLSNPFSDHVIGYRPLAVPPEVGEVRGVRRMAVESDDARTDFTRALCTIGAESLELEGFNIAVAPRFRPAAIPPGTHRWWFARTPMHALGRLHYC